MDQATITTISYFVLAVLFTALELLRPARPRAYRNLPTDVLVGVLYGVAVFPLACFITDRIYNYVNVPAEILSWPLAARVVLFYLVADLGSYWLHRGMHTRHVWRIHRWHHAPETIYWLSGVRATLPQQILFNLPFVLAIPLILGAPSWVYVAIAIEGIFRNNWQHMNVVWRSSWLEWVFVTPRSHHLHHSADRARHEGNYGSLFTFWDRLFGTFVDPERNVPVTFGTGEKTNPVRMFLGV
jgi:sterol desaturase/sphingolipid hydroxylase (fatty acid hydroxylase superfamily)